MKALNLVRSWTFVNATALCVLLLPACASWSTLPGEASAFRTGQVGWGAFMLGQSYSASLRENRVDCFLNAFDVDELAEANFGAVDDQTRKTAATMLKDVFDDQRRAVGWSYPGFIRFDSDSGGAPYLVPPVHRAFVSPLKDCPSLQPPDMNPAPWGASSGTLTVDYPEKNRQVVLKVKINSDGFWITRVPLIRPTGGKAPEAGASPPQPQAPPSQPQAQPLPPSPASAPPASSPIPNPRQ